MAAVSNSVVLDEDVEEDYEPTEEEILEYATWLGMDTDEDPDLLWIAKEGIKAPLPDDWKPCKSSSGSVYYFNIITGESKWEHPRDEYYRIMYITERDKKISSFSDSAELKGPDSEMRHEPDGSEIESPFMQGRNRRLAGSAPQSAQDAVSQHEESMISQLKSDADQRIKDLEQQISNDTKARLEARTKELRESAEKELKRLEAQMESEKTASTQALQRRSRELQESRDQQLRQLEERLSQETEARLLQRSRELRESGEAKLRQLEAQLAEELDGKLAAAALQHAQRRDRHAAADERQATELAAQAARTDAQALAQLDRIGGMLADVESLASALARVAQAAAAAADKAAADKAAAAAADKAAADKAAAGKAAAAASAVVECSADSFPAAARTAAPPPPPSPLLQGGSAGAKSKSPGAVALLAAAAGGAWAAVRARPGAGALWAAHLGAAALACAGEGTGGGAWAAAAAWRDAAGGLWAGWRWPPAAVPAQLLDPEAAAALRRALARLACPTLAALADPARPSWRAVLRAAAEQPALRG